MWSLLRRILASRSFISSLTDITIPKRVSEWFMSWEELYILKTGGTSFGFPKSLEMSSNDPFWAKWKLIITIQGHIYKIYDEIPVYPDLVSCDKKQIFSSPSLIYILANIWRNNVILSNLFWLHFSTIPWSECNAGV